MTKMDMMTKPAPADDMTPEAHFAREYVSNGGVALAAYRTVFPGSTLSPVAMRQDASRMTRNPRVAGLIADARRAAGEALNTSVAELAMQAHELATAKVSELMPVESFSCRVCASLDGVTPAWESIEEYSDAVLEWKASLETPKPRREPMLKGGCNYDQFGPVNPYCKGCGGRGITSVRIVPSDAMSGPAAALYAGAVIADDGTVVRLLFEDRAKWADMRNKLLGLYVAKSENKNLNVNYNLAAPTATQAPMSADDALAKLRALGMLSPDDDNVVSEQ